MSQQLSVGNFSKGLTTNPLAFNIDNDAFPFLLNAYQWRGRIKRKRGTALLNRLTRYFNSSSTAYSASSTIPLVAGAANLLTGFSLQSGGNIVIGSVTITDVTASKTYVDFNENGTFQPQATITGASQTNPCVLTANNNFTIGDKVFISGVAGMTQLNGNTYTITNVSPTTITIGVDATGFTAYSSGGSATDISVSSGTINYATGAITITGGAADSISAIFLYTPDLPVMGLENLNLNAAEFPGNLAFDTTYSYNILTAEPYSIYDVSFYKNPASATYTGYTQKTTVTPTTWNGQDYQQFWTTNYQGAFWATNGINVPFSVTNIGMQYKAITTVDNITTGPPAFADLTITAHGLSVGDFLFINEVSATTGINLQTGYVTIVVNANKVTVEFPNATIATNGTGGIAQYLTNRSDTTKDCLRWYDGDPTTGPVTSPTLNGHLGWVNFAPPLIFTTDNNLSIADLPVGQYYLVGARMILPFKDRLLFFGPVIQTSSANSQVYLQDTVIYSQNGSPYYTASFTDSTTNYGVNPSTTYHPILTPTNQGATPSAFFEDVTGFGGFITAGVAQPILTVAPNEDVLIVGFSNRQTRFVYTGNDLLPFNFFVVNSEFGSGSTFSAVTFDRGVLSFGNQGIIQTAQIGSQRIDLQIPDQIFEFNLTNNGFERIAAQRDFIGEWVYFSYSSSTDDDEINTNFPNQTLQYNYRDETWAIFNESYTTYGTFRASTGFIWRTIDHEFPTWNVWDQAWEDGESTLLQPLVIAGNQQGFVLFRGEGTGEGASLEITSISTNTITSPSHNLNNNDFITISGAIGSIGLNGIVWKVGNVTANTFTISSNVAPLPTGIYLGGGLITRLYIPRILTKQFPTSWGMGRKTRIGAQQYLLTKTDIGQITLQIYLSQNDASPYNEGPIVPQVNSTNDSLIYSTILYTCPESTNLGLTPANTNLQMPTASQQNQIWHRLNTSLIGDTIQIGFTLSPDQMETYSTVGSSLTITGASKATNCMLTCNNTLIANDFVQIDNVQGMTQLNGNVFHVVSANSTTITIDVDSTGFSTYTSGGTATPVAPLIQTAEIELHGFILNVSPSQLLA